MPIDPEAEMPDDALFTCARIPVYAQFAPVGEVPILSTPKFRKPKYSLIDKN